MTGILETLFTVANFRTNYISCPRQMLFKAYDAGSENLPVDEEVFSLCCLDWTMHDIIYKICSVTEWGLAKTKGAFEGSAVDLRDGFIHFSTASQLRETVARHFPGKDNLVILAVNAVALGDLLKWEPSRGGDLFPHLYGELSLSAALSVMPLPLNEKGEHVFPLLHEERC